MKKILFLIPLLCFISTVHAAPVQPKSGVWTVPEKAKKGETIELDALVFNNESKTVTVSVLFATPTDELATVTFTLPFGTAKTATTNWIVPDDQTTVTASVVKAVDASQRTVPDMLGPIGTVTVGTPAKATFSLGGFSIDTKSWFGTVLGVVEPWRKEQAQKYVTLRDQTRKSLNIDTVADITNQFNTTEPPGVSGQAKTPTQRAFPIGAYATLIYASAFAAILASSTIFYIAVVCVILLVFRFFIRLFIN